MSETLQIAIIGATYSGKSCLCSAISNTNVKKPYNHTIGMNVICKYIKRKHILKLNIWEVSAEKKFSVIVFSCIQNCTVLIFCYDSESIQSFNDMIELYKLYETNNYIINKFIIIIETKMDSVNSNHLCHELGNKFSYKHNYPFIQVSSYNDKGISDISDICYKFIYPQDSKDSKDKILKKPKMKKNVDKCIIT